MIHKVGWLLYSKHAFCHKVWHYCQSLACRKMKKIDELINLREKMNVNQASGDLE